MTPFSTILLKELQVLSLYLLCCKYKAILCKIMMTAKAVTTISTYLTI